MVARNRTRKNHKTGKGNGGGNSSVKKGRGKIVLRKSLKKLVKDCQTDISNHYRLRIKKTAN